EAGPDPGRGSRRGRGFGFLRRDRTGPQRERVDRGRKGPQEAGGRAPRLHGRVRPRGLPALVGRAGVRVERVGRRLRRQGSGLDPGRRGRCRRRGLRRRVRPLARPLHQTHLHRSPRHRHRPPRPPGERLQERGLRVGRGRARALRQRPGQPPLRRGQRQPAEGRQGPRGLEAAEPGHLVLVREALDRRQIRLRPDGQTPRKGGPQRDARDLREEM
ncbi:MAG: hypothetical protein AVDCRST_MAG02-3542, partial [uncultured Rubrobacteraceae bacterium]